MPIVIWSPLAHLEIWLDLAEFASKGRVEKRTSLSQKYTNMQGGESVTNQTRQNKWRVLIYAELRLISFWQISPLNTAKLSYSSTPESSILSPTWPLSLPTSAVTRGSSTKVRRRASCPSSPTSRCTPRILKINLQRRPSWCESLP